MALSPDLLSSSSILYCAEDAASWDDEASEWAPLSPADHALAGGPLVLAALIAAEPDHMPRPDYLPRLLARPLDAAARQDAVNWILKVHEFYHFRPVTACLSVNYLDRFLSSNSLPVGAGGWAMQLLSVACVSVAAKMEETHVPLLVDLQILDPRYVFEPRTVRRMELLLMSALRWRMRAITPFDFIDHLAAAVVFPSVLSAARPALLSRASHLILSTHRVVDFLGYRPSAIAAAALLCVAGEITDSSAGDDADSMGCFHECVSKEVVMACRLLMEEYLIDTCPSARGVKSGWEPPPTPQSPIGVLDAAACGSCDSQKSAAAPENPGPDMGCGEAPSKRRRIGEGRCTASIDKSGEGET